MNKSSSLFCYIYFIILKVMTDNELFHYICMYVTDDVFTFEERRSMSVEDFHQYVREHFIPIPKSELITGVIYDGYCRNTNRATWDGEEFHYKRHKFGTTFDDTINHYEDDEGYDVFVPIKEI